MRDDKAIMGSIVLGPCTKGTPKIVEPDFAKTMVEMEAELAQTRERLAVAENLISRISDCLYVNPSWLCHECRRLIDTFLSTPTNPDYVLVWRNQAEQILSALEENTIEWINLKAALGKEEEKP